MSKQFIVRISYTDYVISPEDVVSLLSIASRMRVVKRKGYAGPYYVQDNQDPLVEMASVAEVQEETVPEADPIVIRPIEPPPAKRLTIEDNIPF